MQGKLSSVLRRANDLFKGEVITTCERLGCEAEAFTLTHNPHTGLNMVVCMLCMRCRHLWDEYNKDGRSRTYRLKFQESA